MIGNVYDSDILAGERGYSFFSVNQLTNRKVIFILFVEAGIEKSHKKGK